VYSGSSKISGESVDGSASVVVWKALQTDRHLITRLCQHTLQRSLSAQSNFPVVPYLFHTKFLREVIHGSFCVPGKEKTEVHSTGLSDEKASRPTSKLLGLLLLYAKFKKKVLFKKKLVTESRNLFLVMFFLKM
jgi:hypothetical protein